MIRRAKLLKRAIVEMADQIAAHRDAHGEFPALKNPVTFSDKILHRRLFDRRPLLTQLTDKASVRSYVESRLGADVLTKHYHLTTQPETITFDELPSRFVVKPTHGSGWVQIVTDKSMLDRAALIETCRGWLSRSYYKETLEWAYKNIKPQIIVEELIADGTGTVPIDYKLFVFDGAVQLIQVDTGRFVDHRRRLYTPAWQKVDALFVYDDVTTDIPRPIHLTEMIAAAQKLGQGLDFVRVDFYDTEERIYFGEFTCYPEAGRGQFRPKDFDRRLGAHWKLARLPIDIAKLAMCSAAAWVASRR